MALVWWSQSPSGRRCGRGSLSGRFVPRAQSGELPAPLPVVEFRSARQVTFLDTSGPEEVIKAVDLLGVFWRVLVLTLRL